MSEFEKDNELEITVETEEEEVFEEAEEEYRYIDTGSVPASVLGGIIGMIVTLIICTIIYGIFQSVPYLLFFLFPFIICVFSLLLKGSLTFGGLMCEIIFTALGIFFLPSFLVAFDYVVSMDTSVFSVPLVALSLVGKNNFFSTFTFSTQTVFPILIAILGITIVWHVYKLKKAKLYD